jgi:DNA mismatch repair protein MutS2
MGTDPVQGAAIAQAVVEQLLEQGTKMVVTTHFTRIKALATVDDRFSVAAMEFIDGKPTYRLLWGEVGESHALSLAKRMALPETLLWRAKELMSSSERKIVNLVEELEKQRSQLKQKDEELDFLKKDYQQRVDRMERKERVLDEQQEKIKEHALTEFRASLSKKEQEAKRLIKLLENANSPKEVRKHLKGIKEIKSDVTPKKPQVPSVASNQRIEVGDVVDVITLGCKGTIQRVLAKNKFEASINGFAMVLSREEIASVSQKVTPIKENRGGVLEKEKSIASVIRSSNNTCDVRGCRFEEAMLKIESYFDQKLLENKRLVFILHGHGTGALKKGIRAWLPSCNYAQKWWKAKHSEGGDAFTVVEI